MNNIMKRLKPGSRMEGSFQKIPNELLEKIFSSLAFKWIKVARLVCRRWFQVLNYLNQDKFILNVILSDETIKNVKYFTKSHLASLTVKKLSQDIFKMHGPITIPPSISKFNIRNEIPFIYLVKLLQYYSRSNINELVFTSFSLAHIGAENIPKLLSSLKQWKHLTAMKLWAARCYNNRLSRDEFAKHTQAIAKVLEIIFSPPLELLSLNLDSDGPYHHVKVSKNPLENIYVQLATFLRRHQKLKELELKCFGPDYNSIIAHPSDLWETSIVQLESIKLELREFDLNYMGKFLATQKKVKHVHIESSRPYIIDKLLATNLKSLVSITVFGKPTKLSLAPSSDSVLKSLTVGFYDTACFQQFLSTIRLLTFSLSTATAFPQLVNFNLIDTHFLTESYQRYHYDDFDDTFDNMNRKKEKPIKGELVPQLLAWILKCFSALQQVVFVIRGDTKHASKINNAANCILEKVRDLKTMPLNELSSLIMNDLQEQIHLKNCTCNVIKGRKTTSSSGQCYERSVQIKFCPTATTTPHQY